MLSLSKASLAVDPIDTFLQEKPGGRNAHYKLTSTVMLWLQTNKAASGTMNLGGSLTRQVEFLPGNFQINFKQRNGIEAEN